MRLTESLVTTEALTEAFADAALLGAMIAFEVALARVEAAQGLIPASAAAAIAQAGDAADRFDAAAIARESRASGTIAIPFVDRLRARVRAIDAEAAPFVHWGTTSQDVCDTALVLCVVRAWPLIAGDHGRLLAALRALSDRHAATIMLARTLLQPAPPITFGLKVAGWFSGIARGGARLAAAIDEASALQFGGSSGTLSALGDGRTNSRADDTGLAVGEALARELGLAWPGAPWHTQRDRLAALVTACGVYVGSLGKLARDVALLMQHEVSEAAEPGGGSSAMPHKRNPAGCATILAAAARVPGLVATFLSAMPQEHERGVGGWHAEASTVTAVLQATGAAVAAAAEVAEGLTVDADRMQANLAATNGVIYAERARVILAPALGTDAARTAIEEAIAATRRDGRRFADALRAHPAVAGHEVAAALADLDDPRTALGSADTFRRRLLDEPH